LPPIDIKLDWAQRLTAVGTVISSLSVLALGASLYYTNDDNRQQRRLQIQQTELQVQAQVSDRLAKNVEQLGSPRLSTSLGGIYGLERLMHDSPADQHTVIDILAAYVRDTSHQRSKQSSATVSRGRAPTPPSTELQAALTVLGRQPGAHYWPPDLTGADLTGADLSDANLTEAKLGDATLSGAYLLSAHLAGAILRGADLRGADLRFACLGNAFLERVNLSYANLRAANLGYVWLRSSILHRADLNDADLSHTDLNWSDLRDADLRNADLSHTDLRTARNLGYARLRGANLDGADLGKPRKGNITIKPAVPGRAGSPRRPSPSAVACSSELDDTVDLG
jgi:Pentapeptide repeats (8 copies)